MTRRQRFFVYIVVILAMMIWGLTFIWYKQVFVVLRPLSLVFLRLLMATPVLLLISLVAGRLQKIHRRDLPYFLSLAFFEPFLYFLGESFGLNMVSSTLGSVIIATIPLFTPVAAYFFFRERLAFVNIIGIIISIIGVSMVIIGEANLRGSTLWGVLLMFLAVFSAVGYTVMVNRLAKSYNSLSIVSWQSTIGLFFFLPFFLIFEWHHTMEVQWTFSLLLPLIELAFFGSALAFIFYTFSIRRLGVMRSTVFSNLIPVFTALFSWIFLKDTITLMKIAGIGIVIGGLLMTQFKAGITSGN
jgi:drug/metabolite transporter (DMT)-like permease